MGDQRLQQLRREWDEGDLETQVRLLQERMRTGELSAERVRLAAYLGDSAAQNVVPAPAEIPADAIHFVHDLEAFGEAAWLRGAWTVLRLHREALRRRLGTSGRIQAFKIERHTPLLERGIELIEAYLLTGDRAEELRRWGGSPQRLSVGLALHAVRDACGRVSAIPGQEVIEAVRADLKAWALGLRDPIAERVAARRARG